MTTLVATRQALELLSMGNQAERRTSKRLAGMFTPSMYSDHTNRTTAAADYEQDDDFQFVRKSKRVKTEEPEPELAPVPVKKTGRARAAKGGASKVAPKSDEESLPATKLIRKSTRRNSISEDDPAPAKPTTRKPTRRKPSVDVLNAAEEEPAPAKPVTKQSTRRKANVDVQDEREPKVAKRGTRKGTRRPTEMEDVVEEVPTNGASRGCGGKKGSARQLPPHDEDIVQEAPTNGASRGRRARIGDDLSQAPKEWDVSPQQEAPIQPAKIALPMSDTPIINRNKEMRRKGGNTNRRSSLGTRGRRASSLIDSGQAAIPHREVDTAEFYKHIEAEGLPEPRRMKQLLTWCGERALSDKPPHGSKNASIIHGGRFWRTATNLLGEIGDETDMSQLVRSRTKFLRTFRPDPTSRTGLVEMTGQKRL